MNIKNRKIWFSPFYTGTERERLSIFSFIKRSTGMTIGLTGTVICLVLLYLGMREVMKLGGYVASGGPYEIAHQAPDWIWIMPASIFGGLFFILLNFLNAKKTGGIKLLVFLWPALFLSLGYNFMEYAFIPPGENSGVVISWLICGIFFILMGGVPLLVIMKSIFQLIKNPDQSFQRTFANYYSKPESTEGTFINKQIVTFIVILLNIAGIPLGIYLGITIFKTLSS